MGARRGGGSIGRKSEEREFLGEREGWCGREEGREAESSGRFRHCRVAAREREKENERENARESEGKLGKLREEKLEDRTWGREEGGEN